MQNYEIKSFCITPRHEKSGNSKKIILAIKNRLLFLKQNNSRTPEYKLAFLKTNIGIFYFITLRFPTI